MSEEEREEVDDDFECRIGDDVVDAACDDARDDDVEDDECDGAAV